MGEEFVVTSALMTCTFGMMPCPLTVNPSRTVFMAGMQRANIMDFLPITNIASFGMCSAPTNPAVIAATSAAMGVFTPAPCVPAVSTPWMPGCPTVLVQGMPALTNTCRNMCMWLGQISFSTSGQLPTPPPMTMPPIGKPNIPIPLRMPLSPAEAAAGGGGGGQQQYDNDVKNAQASGRQQDMMGNSFGNMEKQYSKSGQAEKAAAAGKKAQLAKAAAADKSNEAVGDVNQRYRETMPPSKKDMAKLSTAQQQSYQQKREAINANREAAHKQADEDYRNAGRNEKLSATTRDLKKHFANKQAQAELKQLNRNTRKQMKDCNAD